MQFTLHWMEQANFDLGFLKEMNLTDGVRFKIILKSTMHEVYFESRKDIEMLDNQQRSIFKLTTVSLSAR